MKVEDKYSLDANFVTILQDYHEQTRRLLVDISPVINRGTEVAQRVGDKVFMKYLKLQLRYLPAKRNFRIGSVGADVAYANNLYTRLPPVKIFIIRVVKDLADNMTATLLRGGLESKFRPRGTYVQDFDQSIGLELVRGVNLIGKGQVSQSYKQSMISIVDFEQAGPTLRVVSVPQYSYASIFVKFGKKWLYDNASARPRMFRYLVYMQFTDKWQDTAWDQPAVPEDIAIRKLWVYEDA